jgi:hypothetical protein
MNLAELKRLTQLVRATHGLKTEMTPEKIKEAERKLAEQLPPTPKVTATGEKLPE